MSNEERDRDRKEVERFMENLSKNSPDEMALEDTVGMLRGICAFLLKELQKTYMYMERHSIGHDSFLHRDLGQAMDHTEQMLMMFFPDFISLEDEEEKEDDKGTG